MSDDNKTTVVKAVNDEGANFMAPNGYALCLGRFAKANGSTSEVAIHNLAVMLQKLGFGSVIGCLDLGNKAAVLAMLSSRQSIEMFVREPGVRYTTDLEHM